MAGWEIMGGFSMLVRERFRAGRERGANLVEFAIVAPFLILLLFGVVEFAWLFSQNLDVRHGAREGARLAAVNFPVGPVAGNPDRTEAQMEALVAEICSRMDIATDATVNLTSDGVIGSSAVASVTAPARSLTGFFSAFIPPTMTLSSSVETRLEQTAGWANAVDEECP
jgi:Flp pilus assembly protein TadG